MEEKATVLERLNEKVSQVLQQYNSLQGENEMLRTEIVTLKAEREMKNQELTRLADDNAMKDLEIEDIMSKIESILG